MAEFSPVESLKKLFRPTDKSMEVKKENIVGSKEYERKKKDFEEAQEIFDEWDEGLEVYDQLFNRMSTDRDFYLGEKNSQWDLAPEGNIQLVFNLGATVIDLFTYILANNSPTIQFPPEGTDQLAQTKADFGETLVKKLFDNAKFPKRFKDGVKQMFGLGLMWPYSFWNSDNKDGGEKGTWEITLLNPFTTRIKFAGDDYEKVVSFITVKRMLPSAIKKKYDFEAIADSEVNFLPKSILATDDGMASVFNRYDENSIKTVINGRVVSKTEHNLGFIPVRPVNNIIVPNDALGHSEIERWRSVAQELNALITSASEIARDLAYPPILEINNALGGRKIPKWRASKIPVRVSDKGEGVKFMLNTAQIAPLLNQIKLLLDLFHFISLMPKAAAGVFEPSITSGFQAKLAMQPATLTTENRKIDITIMIKELVKDAIRFLEKYDPDALKIKLPNGEDFEFKDLSQHQIQVIWPDNLPIDIAREVQNLILGIQNNLTSVQQAVDRYNVLLGLGSPSDTLEYLKQEAETPEVNPTLAIKVVEVRAKMQEMNNVLGEANSKLEELRGQMGQTGELPGPLQEVANAKNPTNLARGATSPLSGERRTTPQGPETVATTSTGGVAVPTGPVKVRKGIK